MKKFSRYVGLLFSLFLLVFFYKTSVSDYPNAEKLTPLDNTVIVKLLTMKNTTFKFWNSATNHINRCGTSQYPCEDLSQFIDMESFFANLNDMSKLYPPLQESNNQISIKGFGDYEAKQKFYSDANVAVPMQLEKIQGTIKFWIYAINLLWLVAIIMGIKYREKVGNAILSPFKLLGRLLFSGAKVAKDVHDKI